MNKRKLASFLVSFLLGTCGVIYGFPLFFIIFLGFLFWQYRSCAGGRIPGKKTGIYMTVLLAGFSAGGARAGWQDIQSNSAEAFFTSGEEAVLLGNLYQKEQKSGHFYYYLKENQLWSEGKRFACPKILVILDSDECSIGETLLLKGKLMCFEKPGNEGGYNEKVYYESLNIEGAIEGGVVQKRCGKANVFLENLCKIRQKFMDCYENCLKPSHAGVMTAMTLGDKGGMDKDLKTLYQKAGVSHFYSISGIHLSILGMTLYRLLRKGKCTYGMAAGIAGGLMISYGYLTGFGISQTRAIGMFLLLLYAKYRGKSYDRLTALSLLAAVMVWENPKILYHTGFLLSFGAVAGVLLAEQVKMTCHWEDISGVRDTLLVSICIQLSTIPILCNSFYEISLYAILINLFILPCMGLLLGMGLLGGLFGCASVTIGKILLFPCTLILWFFEAVCNLSLKLPFAVFITGKLPTWRIVFWYCSILLLFVFWGKRKRYYVRILMGLGICVMLLLLPLHREMEWDVLDVGQGDGICFMEKDGTTMFLDGGSTSVSKVGTYRILPFLKYHGIRSIDYWFLSHLDNDHVSGMKEVAESGFPIHCLVLAEGIVKDDAWEEMKNFATQQDISILYMKQNSCLEGADWRITCLYPKDKNSESDRNNASLVLLCENGDIRGLFTGDLSSEQEKALAEEYNFPEVDVLKVSHHGSKYGTCMEFLKEVKPKAAVISCGLHNSYGHPGEETLMRLGEAGAVVYDTRFTGQIKIGKSRFMCYNVEDGNTIEVDQ